LGHFAEPGDVADTVAFLAGPRARYITGAIVGIDGGFNI
jgi:3-oxoacyl-[acyl-carrier protein] reductase